MALLVYTLGERGSSRVQRTPPHQLRIMSRTLELEDLGWRMYMNLHLWLM